MSEEPALLEVGRVLRAHGVRGDVVVRFTSDRPERRTPGAVLTGPGGALTVRAARPVPGSADDAVVAFEEVPSRDAAEALQGAVLRAAPIEDPDELWVHRLVGARVVDQDGVERGVVREVHEGVASDLLLLDDGHLVPVTFVVGQEGDRVDVDVPEGLFDL